MANTIVKYVNGEKVRNIKHLKSAIENSKEEYIRLDLEQGLVIVLNRLEAKKASQTILKSHLIGKYYSEDLE